MNINICGNKSCFHFSLQQMCGKVLNSKLCQTGSNQDNMNTDIKCTTCTFKVALSCFQ